MVLVSEIALLSDLTFSASERVVLGENCDASCKLLKEVVLVFLPFS